MNNKTNGLLIAAVAGMLLTGSAQAINIMQNTVIGPGLEAYGDVFNDTETDLFTFHTNHTNNSGVAWNGMTVTLEEWNGSAFQISPDDSGLPDLYASTVFAPHVRINGVTQMTGWTLSWTPGLDQAIFTLTGFVINPGDILHVGGIEVINPDSMTDWRLHFEASVAPVPVPAALPLFVTGLLGLAGMLRKRTTRS